MNLATCCVCKEEKPKSLFYKDKNRKNGIRSLCSECFTKKNKEYYHQKGGKELQKLRAQKHNLKKYGLSVEQYNEMVEKQEGKCKICSSSDSHRTGTKYNLFVDHCHATGKVRGLLCHHCNAGLGHLKDSKEILERAIRYLDESSS